MSTIKKLPKIKRPREKLMRYGPAKLSNVELLAILLGAGRQGKNALTIARQILRKFNAKKLPKASHQELVSQFGLGPVKACQIVACFELSKRLLKDKKSRLYLTPQDVWQEMRFVRNTKKEHLVIFYLDSRSQEIKREIISIGLLDESLVHPREVFEPAVRHLASHIILAHNHPAGDPNPSPQDREITKRLILAGKILGIELIDHVIVTSKSWFSFKEKKLI